MPRNTLLLLAALGSAAPALAADETPPGVEALDEFRNGAARKDSVQNRFFLKSKRFELTPEIGLVPNNPFASRFTVSLGFGYHLNEQLSIGGFVGFSPDLGTNDLKSLTARLLALADDDDFRQPLDKVTLSTAFGVTWAPLYGKINLFGEAVLNFDFYMHVGMGLVIQNEYAAFANPDAESPNDDDYVRLEKGASELRAAPTLGFGGNFFLTQSVALRLDGRFMFIVDDKPVYDVDNPPEGLRAVTMFTASVGVSIFFPKMKPRVFEF